MRERIGNIDYRGKRTQLIQAKPEPIREIQGRAYETVDYGWGPTLQDTNVVGGSRFKYEQSANAALEADLAESRRRRDTAPSLTTKENQEALLAADTARKARLGISDTIAPPGYITTSAPSTRKSAGGPEAAGANVSEIRPDLTSYKPPALDSKEWKTANNEYDRLGIASMPDAKTRDAYFNDNQANSPGSAIVMSESGKVIRLDPTPRYKAEESMTPDEMRQNRPALAAARRNYDVAKEEQLRTEQMAANAAAAKAEATARMKQADHEAARSLEELKQNGNVNQEVIKGYVNQLEKLQEQISSGSKIGPDGRAVPLTEQEMANVLAEKAQLYTEIRATQNRFSGAQNRAAIEEAIKKAIEPGEKPQPSPEPAPSHRKVTGASGSRDKGATLKTPPGPPKTVTEQIQRIDNKQRAALDAYTSALTPSSPEISTITGKPIPILGVSPETSGRMMTNYLGIPEAQKSVRRYLNETAGKKKLPLPQVSPRYEYTPRDSETGLRPLTPMTPMSRSRRPVSRMMPLSLLTPLRKPGVREYEK